MDKNGNLFFVLNDPLALGCWNSKTAYNTENIKVLYRNDATLQFSGGMKVVKNFHGDEELWFVTNRLQVNLLSCYRVTQLFFYSTEIHEWKYESIGSELSHFCGKHKESFEQPNEMQWTVVEKQSTGFLSTKLTFYAIMENFK